MLRDKVIAIFVPVDDFGIEFDTFIQSFRLGEGQPKRNRKASLSDSEIIAILILFHFGSFTNFKHYYNHYVKEHLSDCFPTLVSYNRFIELESRDVCCAAFSSFTLETDPVKSLFFTVP